MTVASSSTNGAQADALRGVRVLDLGTITAGAATSSVLADFGADVIKVESRTHIDPFRAWSQITASSEEENLDKSPPFHTVNRNKRSLGIDLKTGEGRDLFLALIAVSDVVVENFRRGVLERLGLSYETMRAVNPRIVLTSLSSQGVHGAESRYASFGSTLDALGGLMSVTGYDESTPRWSSNNVNYPDQLVSFLAPGAILAALRLVERTGEGTWIDFSQREAVTFSLGEQIRASANTGDIPVPAGNRAPGRIQGAYPTAEPGRWVAVSIPDRDDQWAVLANIVGLDQEEPKFAAAARSSHHDEIDEAIAAWSAGRSAEDASSQLMSAGIAASPVRKAPEVLQDAQLHELDFFQEVSSPLGTLQQRGFTARLSRTPGRVHSHAPNLGQHTRDVLSGLLGMSSDVIDELDHRGIISTVRDARAADLVSSLVAVPETS